MRKTPARQVHLDFHTSEFVPEVGAQFSRRQWQQALKLGHVNAINIFAKCHHGWSYYPTKIGRLHPTLKRPDLMGEQIEACHEIGVECPLYFTVGWSVQDQAAHPEWSVRDRQGKLIVTGGAKPDGRRGGCAAAVRELDVSVPERGVFGADAGADGGDLARCTRRRTGCGTTSRRGRGRRRGRSATARRAGAGWRRKGLRSDHGRAVGVRGGGSGEHFYARRRGSARCAAEEPCLVQQQHERTPTAARLDVQHAPGAGGSADDVGRVAPVPAAVAVFRADGQGAGGDEREVPHLMGRVRRVQPSGCAAV